MRWKEVALIVRTIKEEELTGEQNKVFLSPEFFLARERHCAATLWAGVHVP